MFNRALYDTATLFGMLGVIFLGCVAAMIPIIFVIALCSGTLTAVGGVVFGVGSMAGMFLACLLMCLLHQWVDER